MNSRNVCGGPHPAVIIKSKEAPSPSKPKPGPWVTLPQCAKALFDACSEASSAAGRAGWGGRAGRRRGARRAAGRPRSALVAGSAVSLPCVNAALPNPHKPSDPGAPTNPPRRLPAPHAQAAKAASTLLCSVELAAGYGRCSPKEFQEAHAGAAADACASAAADVTGVEPRSGAWANGTQAGGGGGAAAARPEAGMKIDANASPFNNPYNNPFDNPYWAYYPYNRNGPIYGGASPYGGSPWGNSPWGYGYPPNQGGGSWPYTPSPGTPSNQYANGQWYQFNGQVGRFFPLPPSGGREARP
jgi:hypothetical protein